MSAATSSTPRPLLPAACRRPSPWSAWIRRMACCHGIAAQCITIGRGRPWPRLKNEAGTMELGRVFLAAGTRLWSHKEGILRIGDDTVLDEGAEIIAWQDVSIGSACYVGWDALILDTDLHGRNDAPVRNRPVQIGHNVRIGCRAIVLKGVTIGDGAVVHPGAIVTRDVPAGGQAVSPCARPLEQSRTTAKETH
mgnify:CR=1 FL=1